MFRWLLDWIPIDLTSLDEQTETAMQKIIETEFQEYTIISVLHRLKHIQYFDRIAVLEEGRLVECESLRILLERFCLLGTLHKAQHKEVILR